ncbi:MAG: MoxR family ATPase [Thermoflexales bacterium]|nr:MoxR family ATPase [Thermoflexales bacterium]
MKPSDLAAFLDTLVARQVKLSLMIWGPPGIGKSSIVAQTATARKIGFIDLRLSQLAPTDLRGLPVARNGVSRWYPPEFLPRSGAGVLFLDEINLAPPTMQGMAQQLILDRRVGNYVVPPGWFIWAAGNRSEDRAAVFDMPAPLANRFLHLDTQPDLDSFKAYALKAGLHEQIIAFLAFRPNLLHKLDAQQPAWPSPRSWAMASQLHAIRTDVAPAIGAAAAAEFKAFCEVYRDIPDLERVLDGRGAGLPFPEEPSMRYATVVGLTTRAETPERAFHGFKWLTRVASVEWAQLCAADLFRLMRMQRKHRALFRLIEADPELTVWIDQFNALAGAPAA